MTMRRSLRKTYRGVSELYVAVAATAVFASCGGPTAPILSARISVAPDSASVQVGQQMTLHATVMGTNGKPMQAPIYWSTEDSQVATVSSDGVVTGQAAGQVLVAASSNGVNGSASITVQAPTVASIKVSPSSVSLTIGTTTTLTAKMYAASGQQLQGIPVAWISSDNGIATVSSSGVVKGIAAGTATVLVAAEGQSATVSVTVHHHHDDDS
jgi:uncharacterized protein YjdB